MKIITGTMAVKAVRLFVVLALVIGGTTVTTTDAYGQKKEKKEKKKKEKKQKGGKTLARPAGVNSAVSSYVNDSFDIYEGNQQIADKLTVTDKKITDGGDPASIKKDLNDAKSKLESQQKKIAELLKTSKDMTEKAKGVTPKTDAMKAAKHVKAGTDALNSAKGKIPGQIQQITSQLGRLGG